MFSVEILVFSPRLLWYTCDQPQQSSQGSLFHCTKYYVTIPVNANVEHFIAYIHAYLSTIGKVYAPGHAMQENAGLKRVPHVPVCISALMNGMLNALEVWVLCVPVAPVDLLIDNKQIYEFKSCYFSRWPIPSSFGVIKFASGHLR